MIKRKFTSKGSQPHTYLATLVCRASLRQVAKNSGFVSVQGLDELVADEHFIRSIFTLFDHAG